MIIVNGYVRMQDASQIEALKLAAIAHIKASRAEPGCVDYSLSVDMLDPSIVHVSERWESWDALETHFQSPHMAAWSRILADIRFEGRVIQAYEVKDGRPL